ncbi:MAG: DUF3644 domain-containing protein [Parabacteroides sp.]|nr:DUF3644 domain-containing protein [Parabacteroides sp.]
MSRGLPYNVKLSLDKALDSALLAVETYNKPAIKFKSGGFIVLMCIAWTSLFHAIFFRRGIKPFYREKNNVRFKKIDDELQFWELKTCVKEYFGDQGCAIRKNLEFFIPLRNKIEHKFMPELDPNIFAECQAMLLNFDKITENEFGETYCLRESLSFALQLFPSSKTLNMGIKISKDAEKISKFIEKYRASISTDVLQSGDYSFKAFLIQVANHKSADALPVQFYAYDKLSEEEKKKVERIAGLIKEKHMTIPVVNKNTLKPGTVVKIVQEKLGDPKILKGGKYISQFNMDTHIRCWKKYKVRPENGSDLPSKTNPQYCLYDEPNKSYLFTEEWVSFLVKKMSMEEEYQSLFS